MASSHCIQIKEPLLSQMQIPAEAWLGPRQRDYQGLRSPWASCTGFVCYNYSLVIPDSIQLSSNREFIHCQDVRLSRCLSARMTHTGTTAWYQAPFGQKMSAHVIVIYGQID